MNEIEKIYETLKQASILRQQAQEYESSICRKIEAEIKKQLEERYSYLINTIVKDRVGKTYKVSGLWYSKVPSMGLNLIETCITILKHEDYPLNNIWIIGHKQKKKGGWAIPESNIYAPWEIIT